MYYLYGSKPGVPRKLVATFGSEQQLLAYVRWATLLEKEDALRVSARELARQLQRLEPLRQTLEPRRLDEHRTQSISKHALSKRGVTNYGHTFRQSNTHNANAANCCSWCQTMKM